MASETAVYAQDWSAMTIRTIEQDTLWNRIIPNFPVPMGYQSVKLPSASGLAVVDVADSGFVGTDPHSTSRAATYAASTLTLDNDKAAVYDIPDNLRANTTFDSAALSGYESGQVIADAIDQSFADKIASGVTAASLDIRKSGSLSSPVGFKLQVAADNDGELVRNHFIQAEEHLLKSRAPSNTWFCIIPTSLKRRGMVADDTFYTANNERSDMRIHGIMANDMRFVGNIWGFPTFVTTNHPRQGQTNGTKDAVIWGSTLSAVKHVRAYPFEGVRDRIMIGDHYRQEFEWGLLVTRPQTLVRATYDTTSTS